MEQHLPAAMSGCVRAACTTARSTIISRITRAGTTAQWWANVECYAACATRSAIVGISERKPGYLHPAKSTQLWSCAMLVSSRGRAAHACQHALRRVEGCLRSVRRERGRDGGEVDRPLVGGVFLRRCPLMRRKIGGLNGASAHADYDYDPGGRGSPAATFRTGAGVAATGVV